jgi:hypothetical protein
MFTTYDIYTKVWSLSELWSQNCSWCLLPWQPLFVVPVWSFSSHLPGLSLYKFSIIWDMTCGWTVNGLFKTSTRKAAKKQIHTVNTTKDFSRIFKGSRVLLFLCILTLTLPLAVVSRARKTLRVSTTAGIAQIMAVSSKEGAVIGAVLSTRIFHRGHHWHRTYIAIS